LLEDRESSTDGIQLVFRPTPFFHTTLEEDRRFILPTDSVINFNGCFQKIPLWNHPEQKVYFMGKNMKFEENEQYAYKNQKCTEFLSDMKPLVREITEFVNDTHSSS